MVPGITLSSCDKNPTHKCSDRNLSDLEYTDDVALPCKTSTNLQVFGSHLNDGLCLGFIFHLGSVKGSSKIGLARRRKVLLVGNKWVTWIDLITLVAVSCLELVYRRSAKNFVA